MKTSPDLNGLAGKMAAAIHRRGFGSWLLELGREGGYIFAPAHAVEGDVPLENMRAFIEMATGQ